MFRTVGVIGAGLIGQAIAAHAVRSGLQVRISNSRGPGSLAGLVGQLGGLATAATVEDAASADVVILAVPFVKVPEVGTQVGDWGGRVVVDATNQFARYNPYGGRFELGDETGSEWVARHLPGATMVKAFNAMYGSYVAAEPRHAEGRQAVFYAGDDQHANDEFAEMAAQFGFAPIYVGPLREGGKLLQLDGYLNAKNFLLQE
ncbi:NADPH-dependent F420 reductase [Dactylosporangium darangshiense]|uniref:NADPH-dependent F420 reductase n=1 Tax=Dactylosporangium darangshiense TaxID=579108 RepID=A0ABP8CXX5_9ACTN